MLREKALVACICFCLIILVLSACCAPIKSPQQVDVLPLYNATLLIKSDHVEDLISLDIFDTYNSNIELGGWSSSGDNPDLVNVEVMFEIISDLQHAREEFLWECQRRWDTTDDFIFGGSDDNQYCISYVIAAKHSPDALCLPSGEYSSLVVFQKGGLLIRLDEWTRDKNSRAKDKAIRLLTQAIKQ